jgi:hypothetical protein
MLHGIAGLSSAVLQAQLTVFRLQNSCPAEAFSSAVASGQGQVFSEALASADASAAKQVRHITHCTYSVHRLYITHLITEGSQKPPSRLCFPWACKLVGTPAMPDPHPIHQGRDLVCVYVHIAGMGSTLHLRLTATNHVHAVHPDGC